MNASRKALAVNHACYATLHGYTVIGDSTDYVVNLTMLPTIRNQTARGFPVDPASSEWAAQKAALPSRVPVPPYWSKVRATMAPPTACGDVEARAVLT
jgi:hypothetical protein